MTRPTGLSDSFGRAIRDLRVSVTDRCNFRCLYCLPEMDRAEDLYRTRFGRPPPPSLGVFRPLGWLPKAQILTFEEIERIVRLAVGLGIEKIRLTGGEPLLRQGVEELVARVAVIPGIKDLAMTSNGFLFVQKGRALRQAGLRRISFSLDSLDRDGFKRVTGRDGLGEVLASIDLARELGLEPVKVNAVVIRGLNDHEVESLADFACERQLNLRFIEFMPLDSGHVWLKNSVVPGREILERLRRRFALRPVEPENRSETARRWAFPSGTGQIGIIAPVTEPFCGHCNRIRLTADGKLRTCLFSQEDHDLRPALRGGASDEQLEGLLRALVLGKEERHHIGEPGFEQPERSMSCIGG